MGSDEVTYIDHCPTCGEDRPIYRTVPWQTDTCTVCGNDVEATQNATVTE